METASKLRDRAFTDDEIQVFIMAAFKTAIKQYTQCGAIQAAYWIFGKRETQCIIPWGMSTEMSATVIRHQCKEKQARGMFNIAEFWGIFGTNIDTNIMPSQNPAAKSYIIGILQDVRLGIKVWTAEVHTDGKIHRVNEIKEMLGDDGKHISTLEGAFSDILSNEGAN